MSEVESPVTEQAEAEVVSEEHETFSLAVESSSVDVPVQDEAISERETHQEDKGEEEEDDEEQSGLVRQPLHITAKLNTLEEQRELFLWKYHDVQREDVNEMLRDFRRYDVNKRNGLDYYELMLLMEHRGCVMSATEIMGMVGNEFHDSSTRLSFIEWLCAYYLKDYQDMFVYVDEESRQAALREAMRYTEEARRLEDEMARSHAEREMRASIRAAALERESKLTGVAGMKAFFARKAEDVAFDQTKTNEEQFKEEAARRKAIREARARVSAAYSAANNTEINIDLLAKKLHVAARRAMEEEALAARKKAEEEKLQRSARKAVLAAKWCDVASPVAKSVVAMTPSRSAACPTSPVRQSSVRLGGALFPMSPARAIPFPAV